jgi:hypothetical protein
MYLSVSLKKDGKWRYVRDTWNSGRPASVEKACSSTEEVAWGSLPANAAESAAQQSGLETQWRSAAAAFRLPSRRSIARAPRDIDTLLQSACPRRRVELDSHQVGSAKK